MMVGTRISNLLRRITTLLVICCLAAVVLSPNTAAALPGSGTQEDPWRIQSLADFDEFAADPNYWAGFTRLETDVNLAGRTYSTAVIAPDVNNANYEFDGTAFSGVFDGNDHKVINLTIDDGGAGNWYLGLFGFIRQEGEVSNLGLEGGSVSGDYCVGGLVGGNGDWDHPGGAISYCYSTSDVNGGNYVGGLVGESSYLGSISNCYSTGDVSGDAYVGGLVGESWRGDISNCYSTADVNGTSWNVGGLAGGNRGTVSDCCSTGSVNGTAYGIGGLVGGNSGDISNCYSTSDVNGVAGVGGLVGWNSEGAISNCYSTGDVSGTGWDVGGLVGQNGSSRHPPGIVSNCYSTGDVNGHHSVGGLVGINSFGSVSNCYSTGSISGSSEVGGLVGRNEHIVSNCYSTGDVNGVEGIAGLVGQNGFADWETARSGYIYNSYSTGSVQGTSRVGGLAGYNDVGAIERSFWDVETSGEPNMCGGQRDATGCDPNCGKTTAEMRTRSTFAEAGWDFVDIWLINEGATYPVLRQEIRSDLNADDSVNMLDLALFASHWLEEN